MISSRLRMKNTASTGRSRIKAANIKRDKIEFLNQSFGVMILTVV